VAGTLHPKEIAIRHVQREPSESVVSWRGQQGEAAEPTAVEATRREAGGGREVREKPGDQDARAHPAPVFESER
jgi:hypothetical protein